MPFLENVMTDTNTWEDRHDRATHLTNRIE
jgi:hypothetical protein